MEKIFGKNWKTTLAGIIGFAAQSFIPVLSTGQPVTLGTVMPHAFAALPTLGIGIAAKDSNVTGGTVTQ